MKTVLRVTHYITLALLVYLMAISALEWFSLGRYRHLNTRSAGDLVGLLLGIGLCAAAFWCCIYSRKMGLKSMMWIYVGLFLVSIWFITILYPFQHPGELQTLDPRRIELEESRLLVSMTAACFIAAILLSIGPVLKIGELRRKKTVA